MIITTLPRSPEFESSHNNLLAVKKIDYKNDPKGQGFQRKY